MQMRQKIFFLALDDGQLFRSKGKKNVENWCNVIAYVVQFCRKDPGTLARRFMLSFCAPLMILNISLMTLLRALNLSLLIFHSLSIYHPPC